MDISVDLTPKQLRDALVVARQGLLGDNKYNNSRSAFNKLISECDRLRPVDAMEKHTDELHTPTCGCEDKGPCRYEFRDSDQAGEVLVCRVHEQNSKHDVSLYPYQPCLAIDPWPKNKQEERLSHAAVVHATISTDGNSLCEELNAGERVTTFISQVTCHKCLGLVGRG